MAYREPGVYLETKNNSRYVSNGNTPPLIPLIMGSGAKKMKLTKAIVRGSGTTDTLPSTKVNNILLVGYSSAVNQWAKTTDYALTAPNIITWVASHGPAAGQTYYVVYDADVEATQFEPKLCFTTDDVATFYGPDTQELESGTPLNPVSLGARMTIEEGCPMVYVLQVKPDASGNVGAAEYQAALDTYARFINTIWRIVPMDLTAEINTVVTTHINMYSTPEERMERVTGYGAYYASAPTAFAGATGVFTVIGSYAAGVLNRRVSVIYPDKASKVLSDGLSHNLGAQYIMAAIAGAESIIPVQQSRTRLNLKSLYELKGVNMTRTEKNRLAQRGVMILEQPHGVGSEVVIRHGLTTDMTSVQTREVSIVAITDYVSKYYRNICEPYIGKYNINSETITKIEATLKSGKNQLIGKKVINDGTFGTIMQDEENPDSIAIPASILPPYPCNYIDITLLVE
jgi:hypothetical protein